MKQELKKPSLELTVCAKALLEVSLETPVETLKALLEEGYSHLRELKAAVHCNPTLVNALEYRLNHAEETLQRILSLSQRSA